MNGATSAHRDRLIPAVVIRLALPLVVALLWAAPASGQLATSRCADCHVANQGAPGVVWTSFSVRHLQDWDVSAHSRSDVGCDKCHGGDSQTFESFPAHQGMLSAHNPASPVNRANLPATCGTCHAGPYVAFQKSRHFQLLRQGDDRGPTCTTCHGEAAASLLSPRGLESQCAQCHNAGKTHPRPEYQVNARALMEGVRAVRVTLKEAQSLIKRIKDRTMRATFEETYRQAEVPLLEARDAGHEFVFDNLKERLARAKQRADALMDALANRGP